MQVGIRLPEGKNRFDDAVEFATRAEQLGYDSVWLGEHHLYDGPYWPSPHLVLAGIAPQLNDIAVGTNILQLPLANPVRLAGELSLLGQIHSGQIFLGVSTGYRTEEYNALGIPTKMRGRQMVEYIDAMRELWSNEQASFSGEFVDFENVSISPRPETIPEVYVGGYADGALRAVAELGDAWMPGATPAFDELETHHERLTDVLEQESRELATWPLPRALYVASDRSQAMEKAHAFTKTFYSTIESQGYEDVLDDADSLDEFIESRMIVGTPGECLERIQWLQEKFGTTHLILKMWHPGKPLDEFQRELELVSDRILPYLD